LCTRAGRPISLRCRPARFQPSCDARIPAVDTLRPMVTGRRSSGGALRTSWTGAGGAVRNAVLPDGNPVGAQLQAGALPFHCSTSRNRPVPLLVHPSSWIISNTLLSCGSGGFQSHRGSSPSIGSGQGWGPSIRQAGRTREPACCPPDRANRLPLSARSRGTNRVRASLQTSARPSAFARKLARPGGRSTVEGAPHRSSVRDVFFTTSSPVLQLVHPSCPGEQAFVGPFGICYSPRV